jgi:hypothetical protein
MSPHPSSAPTGALPAAAAAVGLALLPVLSVLAFWQPHWGRAWSAVPALTHLHAATMLAWCVLLALQPALLALGRRRAHRQLGRLAWVLAPVVVLGMLALALAHARPPAGAAIEPFRYALLFVQLSGTLLFGGCVGLALAHRQQPPLHGRWMVASGLSLLDPIVARVFVHVLPAGEALQQWGSVIVSLALAALLVVAERRRLAPGTPGRHVLPAYLAAALLMQGMALWIGDWGPWRAWVDAALG